MSVKKTFVDTNPSRERFHREVEQTIGEMEGVSVTVTTPATANQEFFVPHRLGRTPVDYSIRSQGKPGVLYHSSRDLWTKSVARFKYSASADQILIRLR